mmetsp:Transcript_8818/g.23822  ORF Transcript_8818/g.23822 Transcript_8818/m.23822 type:complete len:241 (+) Transcript_8818:2555-3277(+)
MTCYVKILYIFTEKARSNLQPCAEVGSSQSYCYALLCKASDRPSEQERVCPRIGTFFAQQHHHHDPRDSSRLIAELAVHCCGLCISLLAFLQLALRERNEPRHGLLHSNARGCRCTSESHDRVVIVWHEPIGGEEVLGIGLGEVAPEYLSKHQHGDVISDVLPNLLQQGVLLCVVILFLFFIIAAVVVSVAFLLAKFWLLADLPNENDGVAIVIIPFPQILKLATDVEEMALGAAHVQLC